MKLEKGKAPEFDKGTIQIGDKIVTFKGGKIETIKEAGNSKEEAKIQELEDQLKEQDTRTQVLQDKLGEQELRIAQLNDEANEADNASEALRNQVQEFSQAKLDVVKSLEAEKDKSFKLEEDLDTVNEQLLEANNKLEGYRENPATAEYPTFEVNKVKYQFTTPAFIYLGDKITAEKAVEDQDLLDTLVQKRMGFISRI